MADDKIIISLGGSLIIPEEVDHQFVKDFCDLVVSFVKQDKKFIIITGGGKLCRKYNQAGMQIRDLSKNDLDWLGIHSTRFNAEFIKLLFGEYAEKSIITDPTLPVSFEKPIILGGGWNPGNSTDLVVVLLAKNLGVKKIINLSNTDYVYDKDPRVNQGARKIEKISWAEYRKLIPAEWDPGLSSPFDPVASEMAEQEGITVVTMNGKPIKNLENYLNNKEFTGTVIN